MDLASKLQVLIERAKASVGQDGTEISPTFIASFPDERELVILPEFKEHQQKQRILMLMRFIYAYYEVDEYYFVFEGWTKREDKEGAKKHVPGTLHLDPEKGEAIVAGSVDKYGGKSFHSYKITRDGEKPVISTENDLSDCVKLSGNFWTLLDIRNAKKNGDVTPERLRREMEFVIFAGLNALPGISLVLGGDWTDEQLGVLKKLREESEVC